MRRDQLEHLIRAAGQVLGVDEVIVIGSQAILATVPVGLPPAATRSVEADILPFDDRYETKADLIDGVLGEASMFQETHGIYAQGVGQRTARLPAGWQDRLIPILNENTAGVTGWCLEPHDLCISKLIAGRPKDLEFFRAIAQAGVVEPATLRSRLDGTDVTLDEVQRVRVPIDNVERSRQLRNDNRPPDVTDRGLDLGH